MVKSQMSSLMVLTLLANVLLASGANLNMLTLLDQLLALDSVEPDQKPTVNQTSENSTVVDNSTEHHNPVNEKGFCHSIRCESILYQSLLALGTERFAGVSTKCSFDLVANKCQCCVKYFNDVTNIDDIMKETDRITDRLLTMIALDGASKIKEFELPS